MKNLEEETERLNKALKAIEEKLAALRLGVSAFVYLGDPSKSIGFGKFDQKWCLLYRTGETETRLANTSREMRVRAVAVLHLLPAALHKEAARQLPEVTAAADEAERLAQSFHAELADEAGNA